jgi:hypothetical protein
MYPNDFSQGYGKHFIGICQTEVPTRSERETRQRCELVEGLRNEVHGIE